MGGQDLSDESNLVDWLIVLKEMKLKPSLVKKAVIETTQARNHSFGSIQLDEIAEAVLDRLRRERDAQAYQHGVAKKIGEEDDDVDNLLEFLALTGGRYEEDALLTVLKDKTGQHVLAKVGSGKKQTQRQKRRIFEELGKHDGLSGQFKQHDPTIAIPADQRGCVLVFSSDISAVGEKSTTDHAVQGSQLAFGDHDDDHAVRCVDECGCVVRESTPEDTPVLLSIATDSDIVRDGDGEVGCDCDECDGGLVTENVDTSFRNIGREGSSRGFQRQQETNDAVLFFLTPPVSTPIALATLRGHHQLTIPATSATKGLPSSFLPSALHSLLFKKVDDIYADHLFIEYQPALYLSTNTSKNSKKRRDETKRPSAPFQRSVCRFWRAEEEQEEGNRFHPFDDPSSALKSLHEMLVTGEFVDEEPYIYSSPLLPFKIEEEGQSEKLKQEMNSLSIGMGGGRLNCPNRLTFVFSSIFVSANHPSACIPSFTAQNVGVKE
ncbi:hypothetical protein BLNAU_24843 [Blattamonas nauphoetae]|uniref:Uncharacterized protein n=1 Tax=Blattamonas nauphoetae TaxID=2049346 RepID=A0ABQ9WLB8_9EUKA|nr:hypothetical protein BLNAU_24843 [Blattamonas nauphoetae]